MPSPTSASGSDGCNCAPPRSRRSTSRPPTACELRHDQGGAMTSVSDARILGTGYRTYVGPRLGPQHSTWTLARHTFERIMGLRRPARYKLLPVVTLVIAYLPAIAFIGAIALIPSRR